MFVTLVSHIGFCASGVISTLIINYVQLCGLHDKAIQIFPMFAGPCLCAATLFFPSQQRRFDWRFWIILGCDLVGLVLIVTSISLAGSSIFFLTYAWVTVIAALLKYVWLGKNQSRYQWVALVTMTLGLCYSATDVRMSYGLNVFYGVLAGFGSAVVYSVYYVMCDILGHLPGIRPLCFQKRILRFAS
jgi:drug/metabolite transporter (DMT)-like permease